MRIIIHEGNEGYSCLIFDQRDLIRIMQGEYLQLRNPPISTPQLHHTPHPPHPTPFVLQSFVRVCVCVVVVVVVVDSRDIDVMSMHPSKAVH